MDFVLQAPPLLQAFWYIAIFSTVFFLGFLALTATGGADADHADSFGSDVAHHGDTDFKVFSIRNFINFLLGFSWSGIGLHPHISSKPMLLVVALSVGAAMVYLLFQAMRAVVRLGRDQTVRNEEAIGKTGTVYLTIPAHRAGKGKVTVSIGGALREFDAVTDGTSIANGQAVVVNGLIEGPTLVVVAV